MKTAAIYDPYLDSLGGGERYSLEMGMALRDAGFKTEVIWSDKGSILGEATRRFGLDLREISVKRNFFVGEGLVNKWWEMARYDLIFFVSDGSVPLLGAKVNWLHFQVPFKNVGGGSVGNWLKFQRINRVIVNSRFTKKIIDEEYKVTSEVIYPPVMVGEFASRSKEKIILSVGRFSKLLQAKHQDLMIKTFKELVDDGLDNWTLILAGGKGGISGGDLKKLQWLAKGYPIKFVFDPNFNKLRELYGKSWVFWGASGAGEDENEHPEKVEHFGITLVEAMASGCLVLAARKGGFKEILGGSLGDLLWETPAQLKKMTKVLIGGKVKQAKRWQMRLMDRALEFSEEKFRIDVRQRLKDDFAE